MADEKLARPLLYDVRQTPRDILPGEWQDSLRLDYLGRNEAAAEIADRVLLIGKAVYQLQLNQEDILARLQAVEDALP